MAFFTRKGLTVPEFPNDNVLSEEPEDLISAAADATAADDDEARFDYVVDRTYGVEV